jgi:hypothetical protein
LILIYGITVSSSVSHQKGIKFITVIPLLSQMGKLIKQAWDLQELGECRGFRDGYYCCMSLVEINFLDWVSELHG